MDGRVDTSVTGGGSGRHWASDGILAGFARTLREPGDITLALRIGAFLLTMPRRLDRLPLDAVLGRIRRERERSGSATSGIERVARLRQALLASPLLRHRNTCYVRAMTLYRFLDGGGQRMRIHFGVEPGMAASDRVRGHAWVTLDGELLEAPSSVLAGRVSELYVYPS
ncbi:MAG: lasso peptide biosynthesis B2 protein [Gemmatimonadaceae bacterium]